MTKNADVELFKQTHKVSVFYATGYMSEEEYCYYYKSRLAGRISALKRIRRLRKGLNVVKVVCTIYENSELMETLRC